MSIPKITTCGDPVYSQEESFEGIGHGQPTGNFLEFPVDDGVQRNLIASGSPNLSRKRGPLYSSGSRPSSCGSDLDICGVSDAELFSEISEISSQVNRIQETLSALEDHQMDDKHVRLKQDNAVLHERIRTLEEMLHGTEQRWKEKLKDERHRYKDLVDRAERERDLQKEALSLKVQLLAREHSDCVGVQRKLEEQVDALQCERSSQDERIEILEVQMNDLVKDNEGATDLLSTTRSNAEQRVCEQEALIEDLQEQLESLKMVTDNRCRSSSVMVGSNELEEELSRLKTEQKRLKDENEELHAQVLNASLAEGRNLLSANSSVPSLADEIDTMSKDTLMKTLKEQEMVNKKLRVYIDNMLLKVVDIYPEILEIPDPEGS